MNCGLPILNKDNVMFILDKYVERLEIMRDKLEVKIGKGDNDSEGQLAQVMFATICVRSIRANMRELHEEHTMFSRNEIIELLDECNKRYDSDLKLETMNIITATDIVSLSSDIYNLDACPEFVKYVFDVEDIIPILKLKVDGE